MSEVAGVRGADALRARSASLYTFLKEFTQLRTNTVRTVDQYEDVLWFSDVPREPECDCAAWHRGQDREGGEIWLEVNQPTLLPAPEPSEQLRPWLVLSQVGDSSREIPELREEISIPGRIEAGEELVFRRRLEDHPEIKQEWESYVETQWWPWAEADRRVQAVQRVYTKLFSIYQKQQRLGEQYEVVLGLGTLAWRTPDTQEVLRQVLVASTNISFDAARGVITIGPAGEGAKVRIEQDMLDPKFRPDPDEIRSLESQAADLGDRVWDPAPIDSILSGWVHAASPKGTYREALDPPSRAAADPCICFAPALILRRRTERSFLKAFEEILRQIESGAPIPSGVGRFVSVSGDDGVAREGDPRSPEAKPAPELYFPLEWNEAQRQIIERLGCHEGVLVQGPPGTGKSHTIVNLICHLLASGQRVLVTSHTARALRVLQRYIREKAKEISPLAVVLLGDDREALQAMEDSVQGITSRQNHWNTAESEQKIKELTVQLDLARRDEARTLSELRSIREKETYTHPSLFGGYTGTLQSIAIRLRREEEGFDWIEDRPEEEQEPPLTGTEFQELLELLRAPDLDRWEATGYSDLDPSALPSLAAISAMVENESQATDAYQQVETSRANPAYAHLVNGPAEARKRLIEELGALLLSVDQIKRHLHDWTESAVLQILGDRDRAWRELFDVTNEHLAAIADRARWADETQVSWLIERDHHRVRADAEALLRHLQQGGGWGFGPFRAEPVKRASYLRREVKVGGRACASSEVLKELIAWLDVEERLRVLREKWGPIHRTSVTSFSAQAQDFHDLCEPLEAALAMHKRVARIRTVIQAIPGLAEPTWHDLGALQLLLDCAKAVDEEGRLRDAQNDLAEQYERVAEAVGSPGTDPSGRNLLAALKERDIGKYQATLLQLSQNRNTGVQVRRRKLLLTRLHAAAPQVCEELRATAADELWGHRAGNFEAAWNWARATAWLERLCDPEAEQQLRIQLDSTRERIRNRLREIAAEKAWAHCFDHMSEHERQHLVAWSKAVRSIGKGTGKYAPVHRRSAREHMNECRSAIPAWVMPLYRVAESIQPGKDLFDVVIIDEASQSGPEALLLAYLAKKLVVVGDDKQISPTYAGINHEDVNRLRAQHIAELPHADAYGVNQSFFDLAEIRYQGRIRLREHFRCMPEIIQFSNNLCYPSEPLIPLRQYGGSRLSPVVSARHVADGYLVGRNQNVSNPPEAQAIVDEIVRMNEDGAYEGKTFGVISLVGHAQGKQIEALLLEQLGPEAMENRQLVCGDAYAFQGDERDVMLLSLVSAPSEGRRIGTLVDEAARRRFNVAASRARDQLVLFHTATLNDLSPHCLRHALLEYCQNPSVERAEIDGVPVSELQRIASTADRGRSRPPEPFESWFELDVFLQISARGYRVLPQYEVAGYRIDMVVEGMEHRIAVECDGDEWHGSDQFENDMARQRVLERCGWRFWRVRGSAFSLDPEGALEDLWETLDREGVYPEGYEPPEEPVPQEPVQPPLDQLSSEYSGASTSEPTGDSVEGQAPGAAPVLEARSEGTGIELPRQLETQEAVRALADAPYQAWESSKKLPDPTVARPSALIPGVVEIIGAEGPMSTQQLYRIFVKASGRHRVGRQSRSALNKAVSKAIRDGLLEDRNETGEAGLKGRVLRVAGSPAVVVRPRGNRELTEIPPSEIATLMVRMEKQNPSLRARALYRAVLDFYDTKRMTRNIEQRLQTTDERRELLSSGTRDSRSDEPRGF